MESILTDRANTVEKQFPIKEWWDAEYHPKDIPRKEYKEGDVVLIIDGDVFCYRTAAMVDTRFIRVTNNKGVSKEFKHRTEFKSWCEDKGKDFTKYTIEDVVESEPLSYCLNTLKQALKVAMRNSGATHAELYVEGSGNFRNLLPLPSKYKDREGNYRPTYLKECKEFTLKSLGGYRVCSVETDDFVQTRMYELNQQGVKGITYNVDKDFLQEFRYDPVVYNPMNCEVKQYKGGVGELWETSYGIKGSGLVWLLFQILLGDNSDSYTPKDFFKKRYGEKSFYKEFKDVKDIKELFTKYLNRWEALVPDVVEYTDVFGFSQRKTRMEIIELYMSVAYMKISHDDNTTFQSLLKEYGVEY